VPTYEYECEECGRIYEVWQRISAAALTQCQYCSGPVHRLLAATPFILKGGGWYVTDYPSESRKKAIEAEKKGSGSTPSDGAASPPTKSDSGSSSSGGSGGSSSSGGSGGSSSSGSSGGSSSSTSTTP